MNYKLIVHPDLDSIANRPKVFGKLFKTREELNTAIDTSSLLLLFLQDETDLMPDRSNMVYGEVLLDGEWEEIED